MAGFFPDVPGFRFEYDRDGSIVQTDGGTLSVAQCQGLNRENQASPSLSPIGNFQDSLTVAWPELRTVTGLFTTAQQGIAYTDYASMFTSTNTTNGSDGTWTPVAGLYENVYISSIDIPTTCRNAADGSGRWGIVTVNYPGIRGIKFTPVWHGGHHIMVFHVYGTKPPTENPNRLILCDGTGAVVTDGAYFDFGDSPRASQATKPFRIKNNSASLTANSVTVSFECLWNGSPSLLTQFDFSVNGGASWVTSQMIGSLAPGASTPSYLLRRNTAAGAAAGPWQLRLLAIPASMT